MNPETFKLFLVVCEEHPWSAFISACVVYYLGGMLFTGLTMVVKAFRPATVVPVDISALAKAVVVELKKEMGKQSGPGIR